MATGQYSIPYGRSRSDAIYTDAMARMYGLVALGVVATAAAIWVGDMLGIGGIIFGFGWIGMLLFFGLAFGTLFAANAVVQKGNVSLGTALYFTFAGIWGLFLSPILVQYTGEMIGVAFLLTAGLFVAMSAVGLTTKRDLSKLGPMLFIGLFGVIIVSLINVFLLQSSVLFLSGQHRPAAHLPGPHGLGDQAGEGARSAGRNGRRRQGRDPGGRHRQHRTLPERPQHVHHHPEPARLPLRRRLESLLCLQLVLGKVLIQPLLHLVLCLALESSGKEWKREVQV